MVHSIIHTKRFVKALYIYLLAFLFSTYPFVFNLILPLPSVTILMVVNFVIFILLHSSKIVGTPKNLMTICMLQIIGPVIGLLIIGDLEYVKQILYIVSGLTIISYIKFIGLKRFLFYYNRFLLVVAFLGSVSCILTLLFGDKVLLEYINMDGRPGGLVYFTFTNSNVGSFIRYSGIFDEAGAMAFWGIFALVFNKIYVHDKKIEVPLIACLLLTFSLAYIIQIFFYILLFYGIEARLKTKVIVLIVVLLIVVISYFSLDQDSQIYLSTFARLGIGTSYSIVEDSNRAPLLEMARQVFLSSPWFGVGPTRFYGGEYMSDNPYETLAKDGLIGSFFLYLPLIRTFLWGIKRKEILFASIILFIGYLQRPFHINFIHYTMLYVFYCLSSELNKVKNGSRKYNNSYL